MNPRRLDRDMPPPLEELGDYLVWDGKHPSGYFSVLILDVLCRQYTAEIFKEYAMRSDI
jgi:hypothetical protein